MGREGFSPDRPDNYGLTPLSWAAWKGRDGVVKLLLGREDVSPNRRDKYGQTPLMWSALKGHVGVVMLLKARKVRTLPGIRPSIYSPPHPLASSHTPLSQHFQALYHTLSSLPILIRPPGAMRSPCEHRYLLVPEMPGELMRASLRYVS